MFEGDIFPDFFRGLPYYLLLTLPILIICSNPVLATEFSMQRMSQFDVNGVALGCRSSALSLEAKSLYTWSTSRHCVVAKLEDVTIGQFNEIRQKAGGLVLLLPKIVGALSTEDKESLNLLEQAMLAQPNNIPIYFSRYNQELEKVISDITRTSSDKSTEAKNSNKQGSALSELFASISANGYQIIVSGASHAVNKNSKIPIIQGEILPSKYIKQKDAMDKSNNIPMVIITAHLNTFGLYNDYPLNADTAVFMTIIDLFSKLSHTASGGPKFRLMFLLTESGPLLNFQGVKKWLDENVQLQNVDFVLCLDTVIKAINSDSNELYMHVSKPPKDGTPISNFFKLLKIVAAQNGNVTIDGVHKKINLADTQLAWEHERFSMKRLPSFTLSAIKSPKEPVRTTIFKDSDTEIIENTQRTAKIIAETLARYVYNVQEDGEIFVGDMVKKDLIKTYLSIKSSLHNNDLKNSFEKYLTNVKIIYDKPDARDPDFMFYDGQVATLNVYRVKPAVFDLFLTVLICAYLASVYVFIQYFPTFYDIVCRMTKTQAISQNNSNHNERNKTKMN